MKKIFTLMAALFLLAGTAFAQTEFSLEDSASDWTELKYKNVRDSKNFTVKEGKQKFQVKGSAKGFQFKSKSTEQVLESLTGLHTSRFSEDDPITVSVMDIDKDGYEEIFAVTDAGGSNMTYTMVKYDRIKNEFVFTEKYFYGTFFEFSAEKHLVLCRSHLSSTEYFEEVQNLVTGKTITLACFSGNYELSNEYEALGAISENETDSEKIADFRKLLMTAAE